MTARCFCLSSGIANVIVNVIRASAGLLAIGNLLPTISLAQPLPAPAVSNPVMDSPALNSPALNSPALSSPVINNPVGGDDRPTVPIVLGQPRNAPYIVAIPAADLATLQRVQRYIPNAFITDSRYGPYIQAGAFSDRAPAEERSEGLRGLGFDARVAYFPVP